MSAWVAEGLTNFLLAVALPIQQPCRQLKVCHINYHRLQNYNTAMHVQSSQPLQDLPASRRYVWCQDCLLSWLRLLTRRSHGKPITGDVEEILLFLLECSSTHKGKQDGTPHRKRAGCSRCCHKASPHSTSDNAIGRAIDYNQVQPLQQVAPHQQKTPQGFAVITDAMSWHL